MLKNDSQQVWARSVVANTKCVSDATTGISGLSLSRAHTRSYRLGDVNDISDETLISYEKKNFMATIPRGLRTPYPNVVYFGIANHVIDIACGTTNEKDLRDIKEETDALKSKVPELEAPLTYLQGLSYLISMVGGPNPNYKRFTQAKDIFKKCADIEPMDPHWGRIIQSGIIAVDYKIAKHYDTDNDQEIVSPEKAKQFLESSLYVAETDYAMMAWVNHIEYASVAEDAEHVMIGQEGIERMIDNRCKNDREKDYVRTAVRMMLEERDGQEFRVSQLESMESVQ